MGRAVIALVLAAIATGACSDSARKSGTAANGAVPRIGSAPTAFGLNDSRLAWVGDRVVVADLKARKRTAVATSGSSDYETPVAVAGSTVLWLQVVGGNSKIDTLRAAAPARQRRFGEWGDDDYYLESGPLFGGVAAGGRALVYSIYILTSLERKSDRCYSSGICHWTVTGGGTFIVTPGSLARRRILPPATAVAVEGKTVAAASLAPGTRFSGRETIVVLNLSDGSRRSLGKLADVKQLLLDGSRLGAVTVHSTGRPVLRVWNVKTRRLIRVLRLPSATRPEHFALTGGRVVLRAFSRGPAILSIDVRTGRRTVVARIHSNADDFGPWVSHGRVFWVEEYRRGSAHPYSLIRSALLSPAS